jgi:peptide/nickel transport system substrate-binding protein
MAGSFWDKYTSRRITRRRMLQTTGIAGAAGAAILVAGCGSGNGDKTPTGGTPGTTVTPTEAAGTPKYGGRYAVGSTADFDTFDPYVAIAASVGYFPRLYNVLVNFSSLDSSFRFDDLSTGYEHPDDNKYIFSIRPGVKVSPNPLGVSEHDLDASDVVRSYEYVKEVPKSNAFAFIGKWLASQEASADNTTYTFNATGPYAFFRDRIGSAINTIAPKEVFEDGVRDKLRGQAAGAGPFMLSNYAEGTGATLDKNPNYYRKDENNKDAQLPYVDGIDVKIITDPAATRTAFLDGQLSSYTAQNVDEARQLMSGDKYVQVKSPVNTFISFTMNPTKKPWDDDRIRKAAMYAINRQEYIDRVYNGEAKANGILHWPLGDIALPEDERDKYQKYDPQAARDLIKAATGNDTLEIEVMWAAESAIEQLSLHQPIWQQQMEAAGFKIKARPEAFATWLDDYTNLNYDASLSLNQVYEYAEFNLDWQHSEGPARNNIYGIGVGKLYPEIDAEIDRVKSITDPEEFKQAIWQWQRNVYEKGPTFLPLVSPYSFTLYQKKMKNLPEGIGASANFLSTWYIDEA